MPTAACHCCDGCDKYHDSIAVKDSWIYELYGDRFTVNSARPQAAKELGDGLITVEYCPADDYCIEGIHRELPILGVQWHPERIDYRRTGISGGKILNYFVSRTV